MSERIVRDPQGTWAVSKLPNGMEVRVLLRHGVQPVGGYTAQQIANLARQKEGDK